MSCGFSCSQPACTHDILKGYMGDIFFNPIFTEILDQNLARSAQKKISQGYNRTLALATIMDLGFDFRL